MGSDPSEPAEPQWAALDYPGLSKDFVTTRKEMTDRLGYVCVGWARQVATEAKAQAERSAAIIVAANTSLKLADFGMQSIQSSVAMATVMGLVQSHNVDPNVDRALQELTDIVDRIDTIYLPELSKHEDHLPIPSSVRTLVYAEPGSTYERPDGSTVAFVSPDAIGWAIALDEYKQIAATRAQLMRGFLSFAWDSLWEWIEWGKKKVQQGWIPTVTIGLGVVAAAIVATQLLPRRN